MQTNPSRKLALNKLVTKFFTIKGTRNFITFTKEPSPASDQLNHVQNLISNFPKIVLNTVTWLSEYRRGLGWQSDLLNAYNSELQVRIMLSLFYTLNKYIVFTSRCLIAATKSSGKLNPSCYLTSCTSSQSQSYIATDGRSISKSWC
jgi:hypothetical protein